MTAPTLFAIGIAALTSMSALATPITLNFYVDDRATIVVDGTTVGSYNNPAAAGNIINTLDLSPGWHDLEVDYANQAGTNFLGLTREYAGDTVFTLFPDAELRSLDQNGQITQGLRGDYYTSLGGAFLFTRYGEGPLDHGALSFTNEIYQGVPGLWAGQFGPSAQFGEIVTGQFLVAGVPEPGSLAFVGIGSLLLLLGLRRKASRCV
jgi:hypothetical protein